MQTQVLKLLADVCMFTGILQEPLKALERVYEILMVSKHLLMMNFRYPSPKLEN